MDLETLGREYLRVPKRFSKLVGSWPYLGKFRKNASNVYVMVIATGGLVTQVANVVVFYSIDTLRDQIPFLMVIFASLVKYSNHVINDDKFKELFVSIVSDWHKVKTSDEMAIMVKYAKRAGFFITLYTLNAYFITIGFLLLPFMPRIFDLIVPLNESRHLIQMYPAYYFIENADDYFIYILFYTSLSLMTATSIFIASDTTLMYAVQHACGLLAIAGHRFKYELKEFCTLEKDSMTIHEKMYRKVCFCIASHTRALRYLSEIENIYRMNLFVQVGVIIMSFTITLLKVALITFDMDTYAYYAFIVAQLVHVFILTGQGQFVIDMHDNVYQMVFEGGWYYTNPKTQALYILIQRRNLTPPFLTAGGLVQLNLDSFAEIVKACVSYCTVLKST